MRCAVRILKGGSVSKNHTGVKSNIRMKSVVRAGLVVAAVAVVCVLKKSVSRNRGSSRILQRAVKVSSSA
jgi:hypothetical protein